MTIGRAVLLVTLVVLAMLSACSPSEVSTYTHSSIEPTNRLNPIALSGSELRALEIAYSRFLEEEKKSAADIDVKRISFRIYEGPTTFEVVVRYKDAPSARVVFGGSHAYVIDSRKWIVVKSSITQ